MLTESQCDIRVSWVLAGAQSVWNGWEWRKFTETTMPARLVAAKAGHSARALAAEQAQGEAYRARLGFGLQN